MNDRTPFTYLIGWSNLDTWYYGVRYAKNCSPDDLFTTYFTSSKYVKAFIIEHGTPDVIQIRKTFNSIDEARIWEDKVIIRMRMVKSSKYLNKCSSISIDPKVAGHSKGKTYEEMYGIEKAAELKLTRAESNKIRNLIPWEERSHGRPHGNTNKIRSEENNESKSVKSTLMWENVDFRIHLAQKNNTHFCVLEECKICGKLFNPGNINTINKKKYCSKTCSNKSRYIKMFV